MRGIITTELSSVFRLDKADFDHLASSPRFKDAIVSIARQAEVAVRDEQTASEAAFEDARRIPGSGQRRRRNLCAPTRSTLSRQCGFLKPIVVLPAFPEILRYYTRKARQHQSTA